MKKKCETCDKVLVKKKLEPISQFKKRVTCNRECRTVYIRQERIGWHGNTQLFLNE